MSETTTTQEIHVLQAELGDALQALEESQAYAAFLERELEAADARHQQLLRACAGMAVATQAMAQALEEEALDV